MNTLPMGRRAILMAIPSLGLACSREPDRRRVEASGSAHAVDSAALLDLRTSQSEHGAALVRRVIASLFGRGPMALHPPGTHHPISPPRPMSSRQIEALRTSSGVPFPPSIREWLAYDASFLGWLDEGGLPRLRPRSLGLLAAWNYQDDWGFAALEERLPAAGYWLPIGGETMRFLYDGAADEHGELPILLTDVDDQPFLALAYPGFDVYLAVQARLVERPKSWLDHPVYGSRARFHVDRALGGKDEIELPDLTALGWKLQPGYHPLNKELPVHRWVSPTGRSLAWEKEPVTTEAVALPPFGRVVSFPKPVRP